MFPENLVQACFQQQKTVYKTTIVSTNVSLPLLPDNMTIDDLVNSSVVYDPLNSSLLNDLNGTVFEPMFVSEPTKVFVRELVYEDGINVLG